MASTGADSVTLGLGAALGAGQALEAAAAVQVEEEVEERQLVGLGGEDGAHGDVEELARVPAAQARALPGLHGHAVPARGLGGAPGRVEGHAALEAVERPDGELHLGEAEQRGARDEAVVRAHAGAQGHELPAAGVLGERGHAELGGERAHAILGGADPLAAEIDGIVAEAHRQRAAADAVAGLEHAQRAAAGGERARGGETREPGADHANVHDLAHAGGDDTLAPCPSAP
jgi:hypothetical protein